MRAAVASRNSLLTSMGTSPNTGYIRIYSGTRPTDADTALAGNTLLAELRFNSTAFGAAASGSMTANAITAATASAAGNPTFGRLLALRRPIRII
jgi:hypothetical protein